MPIYIYINLPTEICTRVWKDSGLLLKMKRRSTAHVAEKTIPNCSSYGVGAN